MVIFSAVHFPMFLALRTTYIPVMAHTYVGLTKQNVDSVFLDMDDPLPQVSADRNVLQVHQVELQAKMTFPAYTISAAAFWGQFLLTIFMVTGLVSIPFGLITSWRDRPTPMSETQFKKEKEVLARQVESLLKEGRKIYDSKLKLDGERQGAGFFGGLKKMGESRTLNKSQHVFEVNCMITEKQFYKLQQVAQYKKKVEPLKYACYLILGVLCGVISFVIHIHFWVAGALQAEGVAIQPFISNWFEALSQSKNFGMLGVILYILVGLYLFVAAVHGQIKVGLRFFNFTFYPLQPGETFVNAFFVNALLMNLYMCALTYNLVDLFRWYTRGTQAAIFFEVITRHSEFYGGAFKVDAWVTVYIVWLYISTVYFALKPREVVSDDMAIKKKDLPSR